MGYSYRLAARGLLLFFLFFFFFFLNYVLPPDQADSVVLIDTLLVGFQNRGNNAAEMLSHFRHHITSGFHGVAKKEEILIGSVAFC